MEEDVISYAMRLLAARRMSATIHCAVCGAEVRGVMRRRKYCSRACSQKATRERAKARRSRSAPARRPDTAEPPA
jgi:hypothetical protein